MVTERSTQREVGGYWTVLITKLGDVAVHGESPVSNLKLAIAIVKKTRGQMVWRQVGVSSGDNCDRDRWR